MKQQPQEKKNLIKKHERPHKDLKDTCISIREKNSNKRSLKKRWEKLLSSSKEINDSLLYLHSFSKVTLIS